MFVRGMTFLKTLVNLIVILNEGSEINTKAFSAEPSSWYVTVADG